MAGGWTPWIPVPDWFSHENQGVAVTVTPPDGQGQRDLIVLMVDNPAEKNAGLYRIGHGLAADGTVTGWTPWIDVPDWFSFENQGCGVAVTTPATAPAATWSSSRSTTPSARTRRSTGSLKTSVTMACRPAAGDGGCGVPNWFSYENQGGGLAATELGGARNWSPS